MRSTRSSWLGIVFTAAALLGPQSARADVTVVGRYTFVNGETVTRPSYFSSRRVRVSTPDGREVIFDSKDSRVTLIDHARKVYWDGPVASADSIVDVTDGSRWDLMLKNAAADVKKEWDQAMSIPPDSIRTDEIFKPREIAGYPCNGVTVSAGPYVTIERWTAAALAVDSYCDSTEGVVLAAVLDPVARAVMSMFWESYETTGLCLAASMAFHAPTQQGSFRWEAVKVIGKSIPATAWDVPQGYRLVRLSSEIPAGPTTMSLGERTAVSP